MSVSQDDPADGAAANSFAFLAGVFFPVDSVPTWMEVLSKANLVTYGVDAIRQIFLGSGPAGAGLGVTVFGHHMSLAEEPRKGEAMSAGSLGRWRPAWSSGRSAHRWRGFVTFV